MNYPVISKFNFMKLLLLVMLSLSFSLPLITAKTIYVSTNATGLPADGLTWGTAFRDLNTAFAIALPSDTVCVGQGIYYPTESTDRRLAFELPSGIQLLGGYAGTGTAQPDQRDWQNTPTILSGDIGALGDTIDNSYTIMYMEYIDSNTVIDGFVFERGMANYDTPDLVPNTDPRRSGAALYIQADQGWVYTDIRNCTFRQNYAWAHGGAVYINGRNDGSAGARFHYCRFEENFARLDGGAVYKYGSASVEREQEFYHCDFIKNRAERLAPVLFYYENENLPDNLEFINCSVVENSGNYPIRIFSGKVDAGSFIQVRQNNFRENSTIKPLIWINSFSGRIQKIHIQGNKYVGHNLQGEPLIFIPAGLTTQDSVFSFYDTISQHSGGYLAAEGVKMIDHIYAKSVTNFLLAYEVTKGTNIIIEKCSGYSDLIHGQTCSLSNVMVFTESNFTGKLLWFGSQPNPSFQLQNIMCVNLGIAAFASGNSTSAHAKIKNSYFSSTSSAFSIANGGPNKIIELENCAFPTPAASVPTNILLTNPLYVTNALFVDSAQGDYRLQACSPLRNAGIGHPDIAIDLDGLPRISDGKVDIGPYEHPAFSRAASLNTTATCTNTGTMEATVQHGCMPLQYRWEQNGQNGTSPTGLSVGSFIVTITDAIGNSFSETGQIAQAQLPLLQLSPHTIACGDTIGAEITAVATDGITPYAYVWQGGSETDSIALNRPPGNWQATVTDAHGCTTTATTQVLARGTLLIDTQIDSIICHGNANGIIEVIPQNGLLPFTWQASNGQSSSLLSPLGPGVYTGTVRDSFGCIGSWLVSLPEPAPITVALVIQAASGMQVADGQISIQSITGGQAPYTFIWFDNSMDTLKTNLFPGIYLLHLVDGAGCITDTLIEVSYMVSVDHTTEAQVSVYPNPCTDRLYLISSPDMGGIFSIFDSAGQWLKSGQIMQDQPLSVSNLEAGFYLLDLQWQNGSRSRMPFVKI
jgi:hypothetical protein